jgi:hypothetical protein
MEMPLWTPSFQDSIEIQSKDSKQNYQRDDLLIDTQRDDLLIDKPKFQYLSLK